MEDKRDGAQSIRFCGAKSVGLMEKHAEASDGWRSERAVSAMRSTQYATMP